MGLKFHEDAGHGWLEVEISKLKEMGIDKQISKYSYMDRAKGLAYLEEDIDLAIFCGDNCEMVEKGYTEENLMIINCSNESGNKLEYERVYTERSFIRDLERFSAES